MISFALIFFFFQRLYKAFDYLSTRAYKRMEMAIAGFDKIMDKAVRDFWEEDTKLEEEIKKRRL